MDPRVLRAILKSVTAEAKLIVPTHITTEDAAILMPDLAAEMKSLPTNVISLDELVEKAKKKGGKAKRMSTEDPGLFRRIMKTPSAKKSTNPQAYAAAVHHKITGAWPGEKEHREKEARAKK